MKQRLAQPKGIGLTDAGWVGFTTTWKGPPRERRADRRRCRPARSAQGGAPGPEVEKQLVVDQLMVASNCDIIGPKCKAAMDAKAVTETKRTGARAVLKKQGVVVDDSMAKRNFLRGQPVGECLEARARNAAMVFGPIREAQLHLIDLYGMPQLCGSA